MIRQVKLDAFLEENAGKNIEESGEEIQGSYDLPEGWRWVRLGNVAEIIMGQSPPSTTYNKEGIGLPFYQGKVDFGVLYPTPRVWCSKPIKIAEAGDILISVRAPVGPVNLCRERSCIGRGLAAIRPKNSVLNNFFLFYYLKSIENEWMGKGSTFKAIKKRDLEDLLVPLPPLEEQKRIVSRLEQLVSRVEEAKRLRKQAREEAEKIMEAALNKVFSRAEEKEWNLVKLKDLAQIIMGQSPPSITYNKEGKGLPFYQGKIDFGELYPTPRIWCSKPIKIAEAGDILISVRAPVGPVNICKEKSCIGRGLAAIRPKSSISNLFLFYYLRSCEKMWVGKGSTFGAIKKTDLENLWVPLPSLEEQKRIVTYLDKIREMVTSLKKLQQKTEEELEKLIPLILDKAFRGEL